MCSDLHDMSRKTNKKYRDLRIALYKRGMSIRQFAMANELPLRTVYGAARGERCGVKSVLILKKIADFIQAA